MIPTGSKIRNATVENVQRPSKTWKIDFETGDIIETIDKLDAIKQSVHKILKTKRFEYVIYTTNYGNELETLLGKDRLYVRSEIARMIKEALNVDDRILSIQNMNIEFVGDTAIAKFTVVSNAGTFDVEEEVLI
ncbi:DUF2634 domain-containing protein [Anaerophilus nitritogenes]|uniref:DUF2634 domain-containing protein n=1 Tax=Anaerophilus nitritogenes TaxID=2498136 RepID=UPI00101D1721|nr:DUF2634 domain-containing protein [Anaerophilus nitritogenes]